MFETGDVRDRWCLRTMMFLQVLPRRLEGIFIHVRLLGHVYYSCFRGDMGPIHVAVHIDFRN